MQRFQPNTVLQNRFLLKEELSFDQQTGQQVWVVLDQQTGQSLIARLYVDGRAEWFNDNRPPISESIPPVATPSPIDSERPSVSTQPPPVRTARSLRAVFLFVLALALVIGSYVYRNQLLNSIQALRTTVSPVTTADSTSTTTQAVDTTDLREDVYTIASQSKSNPISVVQAMHLLAVLGQIPARKHAAVFADARLAFTSLRQPSGNHQHINIDSLCAVYVNRGAQSYLAHQQNGDSVSRRYALDWYRMAYAISPSPAVRDRLDRLSNQSRKPLAKSGSSARKVHRPRESLFISDPEVTH